VNSRDWSQCEAQGLGAFDYIVGGSAQTVTKAA
jgi:hypothetical protein